MKATRLFIAFVALTIATLMSACGSSESKFAGKWQSTDGSGAIIEIKNNGDTFLVGVAGEFYPSTVQNGVLVLPPAGIMGSITIVYMHESDALTVTFPPTMVLMYNMKNNKKMSGTQIFKRL